MSKLILIIGFTFFINPIFGQNGYYYNYKFESFIKSKIGTITLQELSNQIKYPPIFRENEIEGFSKFIIKSDGDKSFELIQANSIFDSKKVDTIKNRSAVHSHIFRAVERAFEQLKIKNLNNNTEKCFTEFTILFDISPFREDTDDFDIVISVDKIKISKSTIH